MAGHPGSPTGDGPAVAGRPGSPTGDGHPGDGPAGAGRPGCPTGDGHPGDGPAGAGRPGSPTADGHPGDGPAVAGRPGSPTGDARPWRSGHDRRARREAPMRDARPWTRPPRDRLAAVHSIGSRSSTGRLPRSNERGPPCDAEPTCRHRTSLSRQDGTRNRGHRRRVGHRLPDPAAVCDRVDRRDRPHRREGCCRCRCLDRSSPAHLAASACR